MVIKHIVSRFYYLEVLFIHWFLKP